jgi:hypothetical protein
MDDKPTNTIPLFDTASTGELSGSSTTNSTRTSPNIHSRDAASQTSPRVGTELKPFTYKEQQATESTGTAFQLHEKVSSSSSSAISTGPESNGPISTGYSVNDNEEKQNTDSKTLFEEDKGFLDRNKPTPEDCRDGCDRGLSRFGRNRNDRCDLVKNNRLNSIRPSPVAFNSNDCWKLHSSDASVKNCSVCRDEITEKDKVAFCTTCNEFVYIFPTSQ